MIDATATRWAAFCAQRRPNEALWDTSCRIHEERDAALAALRLAVGLGYEILDEHPPEGELLKRMWEALSMLSEVLRERG